MTPDASIADADLLLESDAASESARKLRAAGNRYLRETYARFPQNGSRDGIRAFDADLGPNDAASHEAQIRLAEETLRAVESIPPVTLEGDDWLDRRGFLSLLRTHLFSERDQQRWRRNPHAHASEAMEAVFFLLVRAGDNLALAMSAIESRLAKIPDFLDAGLTCLHRPVPMWVTMARETAAGAVQFLAEITPALKAASTHEAALESSLRSAAAAFERFAEGISRMEPGEEGSFAAGTAGFEMLLRERNGLDWSLAETTAVGHQLIAECEAALHTEATRLGIRSARETLERVRDEWQPNRPLLELYAETTFRIRDQLVRSGLTPMPAGEHLKVLPVPSFLRNQFPTAAYHAPGAFDADQTGIFWVNDLGATEVDPVKRRAETAQHFGLELTCAHEAYPGHHLQFIVQNLHTSRLRRLFAHAIFYEGWTLWCERLTVEQGLTADPHARLLQLHDALWRAHRVVIDAGLHSGTMTAAQAAQRLVEGVGFSEARAKADVNWYTQSPTVPMSYLCGRLEVERLHQLLVRGRGWTLRQFHDWILSHGAIPWSWILSQATH